MTMQERIWLRPDFDTLPPSSQPGLRWVGSRLMDREQFETEDWQSSTETTGYVYWRPSVSGLLSYAALRRERREERKSAWQARQEADNEWSQHVAGLVDGGSW